MPYVDNLDDIIPDPRNIPLDIEATHRLQAELEAVDFDLKKHHPWVALNGIMYLTGIYPLGDDNRAKLDAAGYKQTGFMFFHPTVQYEISRKDGD